MDIRPDELKNFIKSRFLSGGFFHAVILSGENETDMKNAANVISAAIVCSGSLSERPCNICAGCKKAASGQHPDIIRTSLIKDKAEIIVSQIRDIVSTVNIVPNDADSKVYIIEDADKMNISAQNALLKVLEEPPKFVHFILLSSNTGALLPTIRSRCTFLRLISDAGLQMEAGVLESAENLIKLYLSENKYQIALLINSLERQDRRAVGNFGDTVKLRCMDAIKAGVKGEKRAKLIYLMKIFDTVSQYVDANVSTVHILGLILSKLG